MRMPILRIPIRSIVLCGLVAVASATPTLARWKPEYGKRPPEVQRWYKGQRNAQGQWCCDNSDGHPFFGNYTLNKDGSVTLHLASGPRTLPEYMVLKGTNPTGHAVWWYLETLEGHTDYCFSPGMLT
jgi:hypothetical protein